MIPLLPPLRSCFASVFEHNNDKEVRHSVANSPHDKSSVKAMSKLTPLHDLMVCLARVTTSSTISLFGFSLNE